MIGSSFNSNTYAGISANINIKTTVSNAVITTKNTPKIEENPSKIYGESWVVMQNRLVHAISDLELDQRRLVVFLSPIVRKAVDKDPYTKVFIIDANLYAAEFGLKGHDYYQRVRDAAIGMMGKSFWFWEFDKNDKIHDKAKVVWIGKTVDKQRSSIVEVTLMDDVIQMLSVFDRSNPFTKYQKDLIMNLSGDGIILLELVASFEGKRSRQESFTVEYIREKFNRVDKFSKISEFRRNVLDKAVKELKKHTPYIVSYKPESNKGGRLITDFVFTVKKKPDAITAKDGKAIESTTPTTKKIYKKGLSVNQIAKLAIHKEQFVLVNQHMINDRQLDTYEAFEQMKPLLESKDTVNNFNFLNEFLSASKGGANNLPTKPLPSTKTTAANKPKKDKPKAQKAFAPTKEQIKEIAANPHFQYDYPNPSMEVGSDKHREYLEFRLGSNLTEFSKKPLTLYLS